jgi:phosphate acetyltransferase
MALLDKIHSNAQKHFKKIVLPESFEDRTLKAADYAIENSLAQIILIGKKENILLKARTLGLKNLTNAACVDPLQHDKKDLYINMMIELRKHKGLTHADASKHIEDPLYLATMMIKNGDADGEVAGAMNATGDVLRPAFHYVKTLPGISVVSGAFIMILPEGIYGDQGILIFADCAVHPNPDEKQLAEIAIATARTAEDIAGINPRVAMLSFSTKGSATHELVDIVTNATAIAKTMNPDLLIDGELQVDAALVGSIGKKKAPGSAIAGNANVLIFPDLNSGNIAYKLVQRLANAEAIGPILQGMAAPINDLSRGCSVSDIINMIAITANQAAGIKK